MLALIFQIFVLLLSNFNDLLLTKGLQTPILGMNVYFWDEFKLYFLRLEWPILKLMSWSKVKQFEGIFILPFI